jgi:hypothetical protein
MQENHEFEANLSKVVRPCLRTNKPKNCQAQVTHTYNSSCSGGKEPGGWQFETSPRQLVHKTLSKNHHKKTITKRAGGMAQSVGPEFKTQYYQINNHQVSVTHICNSSYLGG